MKSFLLFIISVVITLLLSELLVGFVLPQDLSGSWRIQNENGLLLNKSNGEAQHQYGERVVRYKFSYPGLRGESPKNDFRKILLLGDSYTFGWLLMEKETYANKLQEKLDAKYGKDEYQIINAAAGGWGSSDYVAYVEDYGKYLSPDIILVVINTDDIGRSINGGKYRLQEDNDLVRKKLKQSNLKSILNSLPFYQWSLENVHLIQLARKAFLSMSMKNSKNPLQKENMTVPVSVSNIDSSDIAVNLGNALFKRLKNLSAKYGSRLLVTTTGFHNFVNTIDIKLEPTKHFLSQAEDFFKSQGIEYFDISNGVYKDMSGSNKKFIIQGDGHPDDAGTTIIAENIWDWLNIILDSKESSN